MLETLIYISAALITLGIPLLYFRYEKRKSLRASETLLKAVERGLDEPASLHPYIDPDICIGSGACVKACPETNVLGLIENRGLLVNPSHCIGHGLCDAACPVEAITLVFGTEKRGVDIPFLKGTFESNVPGIYIAGELGGMGLIRNAITQGRQAVENIARTLDQGNSDGVYDLIIVGAGPAGISASLQAKKEGLNFLTIDQDDLGGTILTYPRRKLVMTQPIVLPLYGNLKFKEIIKEELVDLFQDIFKKTGLTVNANEKVENISSSNGHFNVVTAKGEYLSKRVMLAIGRRGSPRKLAVPGEKSSKVAYRLLDPEKFTDLKIAVIGGGDSAIEAALALAEQPGNNVHLSYRKEGFFRIKQGNKLRIDKAIENKSVIPLFNSQASAIDDSEIVFEQQAKKFTLQNDYVFVLIGGELPSQFLERAGIKFTRKFGEA